MSTADQLVELMFSLIKQRERCAEQLRKLARELESLREKCNVSECVGSSVAVVGAACVIGAGVATLFTGGAAALVLGVIGAVSSGAGVGVSVVTKITEHFVSSDTMKEAQKIEEKSKEITQEIQKLFEQLKVERKEVSRFADPDELDLHVLTEILRAVARRRGIKQKINVRMVDDEPQVFCGACPINMTCNQNFFRPEVMTGVTVGLTGILVFFTFEVTGKQSKRLFSKGAEQLIKRMSTTGLKTVLKGGAKVVGGAVGMAFALHEAIDNWKDLVKNTHVTEASQSLRDTADAILKSTETLKEQFNDIERMLKKMAESEEKDKNKEEEEEEEKLKTVFITREEIVEEEESDSEEEESDSEEEESDSEEESEDDEAIRVGLLNVQSMNNKPKKILNLIEENNLDVFLTTETWLRDDTADDVLREASPENFSFHHQAREGRGGGVAIQFSEELQVKRIRFDFITTFEYVATVLKHPKWDNPVLIINVYRPPQTDRDQFLTFLEEFEKLFEAHTNILVTGDFNISEPEKWSYHCNFLLYLEISGLVQHVKVPTHKGRKHKNRHRRGNTLDLVITRNVEISGVFVRNDNISDHYTVYFKAKPTSKETKHSEEDEQAKRFKKK